MSNYKFTEGDWNWYGRFICIGNPVKGDCVRIGEAPMAQGVVDHQEAVSNAILMAASKRMFEMLSKTQNGWDVADAEWFADLTDLLIETEAEVAA